MQILRLLLASLFLFSIPTEGTSQQMHIVGTVHDSTGTKPLPNATIMAVRMKDSLLIGFSHSDRSGNFTLKDFPIDTFSLIVSYPKCDDKTYLIFGSSTNYELTIPSIRMQPESKELEAVVIYANKNPIFYKGDTLVYVADSFNVAQNAVVEDLLKKLPGLKVEKDGTIKSQGKKINQVLVDGDEFFGNDGSVATKNLGAKGVETVEIYEKKNENAADGADETVQVMNLKLKEEAKKGYFGKISLASDFQNFYQGELLLNKFDGAQKISVFMLGSNTPRSQFDWSEKNKFGITEQISYNEEEDSWTGTPDYNYSTQGIPKTLKTGIYYSDKIGKKDKTKISFNYSLTNSNLTAYTKSRSHYFLEDTTYYSDDSTHNYNLFEHHSFNFSLVSTLDSLTTITIEPSASFQTGSRSHLESALYSSENLQLSRTNLITNDNKTKGNTLENQFEIFRKFKKPKRTIILNYTVSNGSNQLNGGLLSNNQYTNTSSLSDSVDQSKFDDENNAKQIGSITYLEPLTKRFLLQLNYKYEYSNFYQTKETRDKINGEYSVLNLDYSNKFGTIRQHNKGIVYLNYQTKKFKIIGGSAIKNSFVSNENLISGGTIYQTFTTLLPRFSFVYNPSMNKRINFDYSTFNRLPSISALQPVNDNSNPNYIIEGNPSLRQAYEHKFQVNLNFWESLSGRYFYANITSSFIKNNFANSTFYDTNVVGRVTSKTININGNNNSNLYLGVGGIPIYKKIITFDANLNGSYSESKNLINNQVNFSKYSVAGCSVGFNFEKDSLSIYLSSNLNYNNLTNSISSVANTPYSTKSIYGGITWKLPHHIKIWTDVDYTINSKRANGYNINYLIWNMEVSKAFLKTENLIVSLVGNDILNQNISAVRTVNINVITDNKTKIISRYFLLKMTMKFNNNKTKESDGDENW